MLRASWSSSRGSSTGAASRSSTASRSFGSETSRTALHPAEEARQHLPVRVPYVTSVEPRWSPMLQFLDEPEHRVFTNLPGNSITGRTEPYVCVAPVLNFYLLSEKRAAEIGEPWVLGT